MAYYNSSYQQYTSPGGSPTFSQASTPTSVSSVVTNYSFHNPRLRYYMSKSFDIEDDLEFCPEIPDYGVAKKFNPYTATTFSPSQSEVAPASPRYNSARIKRPIEIVNPNKLGSPAS
ncbi:hypothetical protein DICA3_E20560 [Diutina catenulata]